jgi:hypothetical protein
MRGPASWLPKWIQFLRLCKDLHKRNYEQSGIRQSSHKLGCKKLASLLCSSKVKTGEVLRDGFSHTPWIHPYFSAKQLAVGWRLTALA